MTIQLKNHVSGQCLDTYYSSGTWYVRTANCDNVATSQQWLWSGNQLQSAHNSLCVSVSSSSATSLLYLTTCDSVDTKQHWQYSNTIIISDYWSGYALIYSPLSSLVGLKYSGSDWFQYWEDGSNTAPSSPIIISLKNHVSEKCLYTYASGSYTYISTATCDDIDISQQWAWFDNHLETISRGQCLAVSSSSATGTLRVYDCNPADTKQHWQYNNTIITADYWPSYALIYSPLSSLVGLKYSGSDWFQYWINGTNTAPISPNIISLKNHVSEKCLYTYASGSYTYISTATCDDTDISQQWAWFDNHLETISRGQCLAVSSSSATGTLRVYDCNPADTKQHWQYNNTIITADYWPSYALIYSPLSSLVGLKYSGSDWFQYWINGTNTAPISPNIISLKNHVSEKCLYTYASGSYTYINTATCDDTDISQQWAWFDNHLETISRGQCLAVSSSSATGTLRVYDCNPVDTKQHWQYNNTIITADYWSSYALIYSPLSGLVGLKYSGSDWFQYWINGTNTAPISPNIVSVQNHATGECLYTYASGSYTYVRTATCNDADVSQKWAWFDNHLQSISRGQCLSVSSSSATAALRVYDCNPADPKQHWQLDVNNVIISSGYYSGYCLTNNDNSAAYSDSCGNNNNFQKWDSTNDTFTFSPTPNPTSTTEIPTIFPTIDPTINPTIYPTIKPTVNPTISTANPTINPTGNPITYPTINPSSDPTIQPTLNPVMNPTVNPTMNPSEDSATEPVTSDLSINPTIDSGDANASTQIEISIITMLVIGTVAIIHELG